MNGIMAARSMIPVDLVAVDLAYRLYASLDSRVAGMMHGLKPKSHAMNYLARH